MSVTAPAVHEAKCCTQKHSGTATALHLMAPLLAHPAAAGADILCRRRRHQQHKVQLGRAGRLGHLPVPRAGRARDTGALVPHLVRGAPARGPLVENLQVMEWAGRTGPWQRQVPALSRHLLTTSSATVLATHTAEHTWSCVTKQTDVAGGEHLRHAYVMSCCTACAAWHCMCRSLAGTNMGVLLDHQRAVTPTVRKAWWGATDATACPCAQGEHGHSGRVCAGHSDQRAGHPEPRVRALRTLIQYMSSRTNICWCGAAQFLCGAVRCGAVSPYH